MPEASLTEAVRANVSDIHVFFEDWFGGRVSPDQLEEGFLNHLHPDFFYVPPAGVLVPKPALAEMFLAGHSTNPALEIDITDVVIQHDMGDHLLVSYREIQRGALPPEAASNERLSTVLMSKAQPFVWLSVHETAIAT